VSESLEIAFASPDSSLMPRRVITSGADRYESTLDDIFDLQDRVTMSVIGAIAPHLERAEIARAQRKPTESLQAYDYYLRALASVYRRTREANIEALKFTQTANNLDPDFAAPFRAGGNLPLSKGGALAGSGALAGVVVVLKIKLRLDDWRDGPIELDKDDPTVLAFAGASPRDTRRRSGGGSGAISACHKPRSKFGRPHEFGTGSYSLISVTEMPR